MFVVPLSCEDRISRKKNNKKNQKQKQQFLLHLQTNAFSLILKKYIEIHEQQNISYTIRLEHCVTWFTTNFYKGIKNINEKLS